MRKMKNHCHTGLISWLREALDKNLFEGLRWENEKERIFFIVWTHKSDEHWTTEDMKPFRAWAEFKGKLTNKNPKTLKATFRCALNSKKDELRELKRQGNRRFWQFIDPKTNQGKLTNKKEPEPKRKQVIVEQNNRVGYSLLKNAVNSIFEGFYQSFEGKTPDKKKHRLECNPTDNIPQNMNTIPSFEVLVDIITKVLDSLFCARDKIQRQSKMNKPPPFQSSSNIQALWLPYQDNETIHSSTECNVGINSPDASRTTPQLTPKNYSDVPCFSPCSEQLSTDVWQPNCRTISSTQQCFNSMDQFSNDPEELSETAIRKFRDNIAGMEQFTTVMNMDNQMLYRDEALNSPSKPLLEKSQMSDWREMCDWSKLEDLLYSRETFSIRDSCETDLYYVLGSAGVSFSPYSDGLLEDS